MDNTQPQAGPSTQQAGKKRAQSDDEDSSAVAKRPRLLSISSTTTSTSTAEINILRETKPRTDATPERTRRTLRRERTESDVSLMSSASFSTMSPSRRLNGPGLFRTSSFTFGHSRPSSVVSSSSGVIHHSGRDFSKRCLSLSFDEAYDGPVVEPQKFPEQSAKHFMRNTRVIIDFSLPPPPRPLPPPLPPTNAEPPATLPTPAVTPTTNPQPIVNSVNNLITYVPLALSSKNNLFFTRGDRVHYKNITSESHPVAQLCRTKESLGQLRIIDAHPLSYNVALGHSGGCVQIYDVAANSASSAKTPLLSFTTKEITAMSFHGPSNPSLITLGSSNGAIRYYDVRERPAKKGQKNTRHRSVVTKIAVNFEDSRLVASGDADGIVHCWDMRNSKTPLEVGEFVQRRKKMVHDGVITALGWCSWLPKLLASGSSSPDGKGTVKTWNISGSIPPINAAPSQPNFFCPRPAPPPKSDLTNPGVVHFETQVTSIHFSPQCKEILFTHGSGSPSGSSHSPPSLPTPPSSYAGSPTTTAELDEIYTVAPRLPPATANAMSVHSAHALRLVLTERVAEYHYRNGVDSRAPPGGIGGGIGGSVINSSGTKVVVSIPSEGKLRMYECWGKIKERSHSAFTDMLIR